MKKAPSFFKIFYAIGIWLFINLCACTTLPTTPKQTYKFDPANLGKGHLVESCRVYDLNGELLRTIINGKGLCYLVDDGSVLFSDLKSTLTYFDQDYNVIWKKQIVAHHQINVAKNGDFLVLGSENHTLNGKVFRFDTFFRISKDGQIISKFSLFDQKEALEKFIETAFTNQTALGSYYSNGINYFKARDKIKPVSHLEQELYGPDVVGEFTHANSIYEIPENISKNSAFKEGNIIINLSHLGAILILSSDFKEMETAIPAPSPFTHDVHVLKNGSLFIYNNFFNYKTPADYKKKIFSAIEIYDFPSMNLINSYGHASQESFFSKISGGGDFLQNGAFIFSTVEGNLAFIKMYNINTKNLIEKQMGFVDKFGIFQQIKYRDMTEFLSKNHFQKIMNL